MSHTHWAPLAWGFRPFFLLSGVFALIAVLIWLFVLHNGMGAFGSLPISLWHGHEMLHGFLGAAIAGFLLTAVANWTGQPSVAGRPLLLLVVLWLVGRFAFGFSNLVPTILFVIAPLLFLPAVFGLIAKQLWPSDDRRLPILAIMGLYWLTDAAFIIAVANESWAVASTALRAGIATVLLLITLIGGRIIPVFTANALRKQGARIQTPATPGLDRAVLFLMFAYLCVDVIAPMSTAMLVTAACAGLVQLWRFTQWHGHRAWREPIVWVLHAGFLMLPLGLLMRAIHLSGATPWVTHWQHVLTMGAASMMVLAVMTRAALGHTGRPLKVASPVVLAYFSLILAMLTRVFGPYAGYSYLTVLSVAGALWVLSFSLYVIVYAPILTRSRSDGKAG